MSLTAAHTKSRTYVRNFAHMRWAMRACLFWGVRLRTHQLTRRYIEVATLDMLLLRANPMTNSVMTLALMAQDRGVQNPSQGIGPFPQGV